MEAGKRPDRPSTPRPATPESAFVTPAPIRGRDFSVETTRRVEDISYATFLERTISRELTAFPEVSQWVKERVDALPEMETATAPLTNDKWHAEMGEQEGEVNKITGAFFAVEGLHVETPKFSWDQPMIEQSTAHIILPTSEGQVAADVSGMVGVIRDDKGNILVTVGQEPGADTPKHALIRTPLQTSAQKFRDLQAGEEQKDPALMQLLHVLYGEENAFATFLSRMESGEVGVWPLAPADANRLHALNIGINITVADEEKQRELTLEGKNRWINTAEWQALRQTGFVNGHTVAAVGE